LQACTVHKWGLFIGVIGPFILSLPVGFDVKNNKCPDHSTPQKLEIMSL